MTLDLATAETQAFFESRAVGWDDMMPDDLDEVLGAMLAPFGPLLGRAFRVLDVGTGTGALIPHLSRFVRDDSLISLDLAHAMLNHARKRCPSARLVQSDVHRLPFANAHEVGFDLVVCHNSFPHYADKPRALSEFWRVLRPTGQLLILHNLSRLQVNAIHTGAGGPLADHVVPPGANMNRLLQEAGFDSIVVEDEDDHYLATGQKP